MSKVKSEQDLSVSQNKKQENKSIYSERQWLIFKNISLWIILGITIYLFHVLGQPENYLKLSDFLNSFPLVKTNIAILCFALCYIIASLVLSQEFNKKKSKAAEDAKTSNQNAPSSYQIFKKYAFSVWEKIELAPECTHTILIVVLWFLLKYEDKLPAYFRNDAELIQKLQLSLVNVYLKIFIAFIFARLAFQFYLALHRQAESILHRIIRVILTSACIAGNIIIEVFIVEIALTKETFFRNIFLSHLS